MQRLSDDLINFSNMLMLARERGEVIRLANDLNNIVLKAMEIEKAGTVEFPQLKKKTLSAEIKFKKEEVDMMSKTFKKEFIANGCVGHIIKRPSGKKSFYYEIRYRRNGFNISVSNTDLDTTKKLFIKATHNLNSPPKKKNQFGNIIDEWLIYKKANITYHQWQNHESRARRFIPDSLKSKQIEEIKSYDIEHIINSSQNSERMCEELRSLFNQIFKLLLQTESSIIIR